MALLLELGRLKKKVTMKPTTKAGGRSHPQEDAEVGINYPCFFLVRYYAVSGILVFTIEGRSWNLVWMLTIFG